MRKISRQACVCSAVLFVLSQSILLAQSPPVLSASYLYGGAGDQYGSGITKDGSHVYLSGSSGGSGTLLLKIDPSNGSVVWTATPLEAMIHHDVAVDASNAYIVGGAYDPVCGALDGFGGGEAKPLFGIYGLSSGVKSFCASVNYYPFYRGYENYYSIAGGGGTYYAAGWAEEGGFGAHRYVVTKYSSAGALQNFKTDTLSYSFGYGVAVDSAGIYISGFRRNSSWHGDPELPFLVKLDTNLDEVWRQTITPGVGDRARFFDLTLDGGFVYVVGQWNSGGNEEFLAAKFSTAGGSPIWQSVWGTAGLDALRDVVVVGGRLFAVGTSSDNAVLVELNPVTGGVLPSPPPFGGSGYEDAQRIVADGSHLFVSAFSNSFNTPAGNVVGSNDALLLHYLVKLQVTIDIKPGGFPNSVDLRSNGTVPVAILSSPTFDASTVDPETVTLAGSPVDLRGNGTPHASAQDVSGDGLPDLVVHVRTQTLQLTSAATQAALSGATYSGQLIEGTDSVRIVK